MTLFEECKEALKEDFHIVEDEQKAIEILQTFPITYDYIMWSELSYKDYDHMEDIVNDLSILSNKSLYVLADNADVPVFRSNLKVIMENIYDVSALSPKVFIFNQDVIIEPLFPSYNLRVGLKNELLK
jgi:hypothetical protein